MDFTEGRIGRVVSRACDSCDSFYSNFPLFYKFVTRAHIPATESGKEGLKQLSIFYMIPTRMENTWQHFTLTWELKKVSKLTYPLNS